MTDLTINGTVVSGNVVEVIISLAVAEVEGIASVGGVNSGSLKGRVSGAKELQIIEAEVRENDRLYVGVHVGVFFGYAIPEVAAKVRNAVAFAVESQLGAEVDQVDVFVDGIKFAE